MKNKKIMFVFILIVAFLLVMTSYTQANEGFEQLNILQGNGTSNEDTNNETVGNNVQSGNAINNIETNNQVNTNTNSLPQTGVEDNPTLFIFIAICIVSAVYAYIKIRKYNNIH